MSMLNYGAKLSKTDLRDYTLKANPTDVTNFKLKNLPAVKHQHSIKSCVAHSASYILEWFNKKETGEYRMLSTGFIYGMQAIACNRMKRGMFLRDACKIIQKYGDCLHETIPFDIEMPECYERLAANLNDDVYNEAAICKVGSYAQCTTDDAIKHALMTYGPVLASVKWYNIYGLTLGGVIDFNTTSGSGYHAVMVYGFNEKGWLCQNSWGKGWANNGRFILPYKYGFAEAWSFVDAANSDVHKPKRNKVLDVIYRILNFVINLFNYDKI